MATLERSQDIQKDAFLQAMKSAILIQKWYRGYQGRIKSKMIKQGQNVKISKYFQLDDFWETISSKREFKFTSPRFKKDRYVFKSGAIYSGEWKGGF